MVNERAIGIGGLVSQHGCMSRLRDERGGIEKIALVEALKIRFDATDNSVEDIFKFAEHCKVIYEKDSRIYLNGHYNPKTRRYTPID